MIFGTRTKYRATCLDKLSIIGANLTEIECRSYQNDNFFYFQSEFVCDGLYSQIGNKEE